MHTFLGVEGGTLLVILRENRAPANDLGYIFYEYFSGIEILRCLNVL